MLPKIIKVHTAATRELAALLAERLRHQCKPCCDPFFTETPVAKYWQVNQYVTTSYPEI